LELLAALPDLDFLTNILRVAIGLSLVVFFHELGRYAVAKWCDVMVERFSIGFGPILFSRKWGETEYALSAIPFGGYVKMLGQDDMDSSQMTDEEIAEDPRSYMAKKVWQRMAIISAGVIMNVVTAALFYTAAFLIGIHPAPPVVGSVAVGKPAWHAGLQTGDRITKINGKDITSFTELRLAVALSNGPLKVVIENTTGEVVKRDILPDGNGDMRILGILPPRELSIPSKKMLGGNPFTISGAGADLAEPKFEPGDVIHKIDGQEVSEFHEMQDILTTRADETLDFSVQRKDAPADSLTKVSVPPTPFLELGVVMDIGAIKFIKDDCPAQKAGLKIGDKIVLVNQQQVGPDIDPLRLPEVFSKLAGEEVVVYVRRESGEETPAEPTDASEMPEGMEETKGLVRIALTPHDRSAWSEWPSNQDSLTTAGIAYEITRTVLSVTEGSPAQGEIEAGDRIQSIEYLSPEEGDETPAESKADNKIEFADAEHRDRPTDWAYPFWLMQQLRDHDIKLTISRAGETKEVTMTPVPIAAHEWFLPIRGLILNIDKYELQTDDFGEAFSMGVNSTKNKGLEIYLTLRSLVRGDVSITNLQGPVGIAKAAYTISSHGMGELLAFLGFLSVNLAVLNFLPIPILDGGHMVFLCWEGITGQKPSQRVLEAATWVGAMFLLSLVALVMYMDIFVRILGWGED